MEFCPSSEFVHQTVRQRWVRHITRTQYTVSYCLKVWLTSKVSVIITSWNCAGQNSRCLLHSDYTQACSSVKKQPPSTHHGNLIHSFRPCGYNKKKKNKKAKVLHICRYHLGYTRGCPYFIPEPAELAAGALGWDRLAGLNIMGMFGTCWLAVGLANLELPPSPNSWAWKRKNKAGCHYVHLARLHVLSSAQGLSEDRVLWENHLRRAGDSGGAVNLTSSQCSRQPPENKEHSKQSPDLSLTFGQDLFELTMLVFQLLMSAYCLFSPVNLSGNSCWCSASHCLHYLQTNFMKAAGILWNYCLWRFVASCNFSTGDWRSHIFSQHH